MHTVQATLQKPERTIQIQKEELLIVRSIFASGWVKVWNIQAVNNGGLGLESKRISYATLI